jgi:hypothetical protein
VAFTETDVGHGLFSPRLLLLLILQHHHQQRPWVSRTPFPLLYHLVHIFSWFSLCSFQKVSFFFFSLGKIRESYCGVENFVVENWSNLLDQFFLGGWGRGRLLFCNIFEADLGELVFQHNFTSFMKSENWKKKKKGKKYIRSLKMCLLFLKTYFTWDQWFFFWNFLQFFNLKNLILTYAKDCLYVEMAQIRQNLSI